MKRTLAFIGLALVVLLLVRHKGLLVHDDDEDTQPAIVTPYAADAPDWRTSVANEDANKAANTVAIEAPTGELQSVSQLTFMGKSCLGDCAPLLAGYRWAEQQGMEDPQDCPGNGEFRDGCAMYAAIERDYNR